MLLVVAEVVIIWLKLLILMTEKMPYAGDPELLREKLLSIPDHISNVHDYPDNQQYKSGLPCLGKMGQESRMCHI